MNVSPRVAHVPPGPASAAAVSARASLAASASARAYWAGGATLGPIYAFSYLAANAAHQEQAKVAN